MSNTPVISFTREKNREVLVPAGSSKAIIHTHANSNTNNDTSVAALLSSSQNQNQRHRNVSLSSSTNTNINAYKKTNPNTMSNRKYSSVSASRNIVNSVNHNNNTAHSNSSNNNSNGTNKRKQYTSPLLHILYDLRRKHASAAGPSVGVLGTTGYKPQPTPHFVSFDAASSIHTAPSPSSGVSQSSSYGMNISEHDLDAPVLIDFSVLPLAFAGDVDIEDVARRLSEEENDKSWAVIEQRRYNKRQYNTTYNIAMANNTDNNDHSNSNTTDNNMCMDEERFFNAKFNSYASYMGHLGHPTNAVHTALSSSQGMNYNSSLSYFTRHASSLNFTSISPPRRQSMEHPKNSTTNTTMNSTSTTHHIHHHHPNPSSDQHHYHSCNLHGHHNEYSHRFGNFTSSSSTHVDYLLSCAPHLRHINAASADMLPSIQTSLNPISYILSSTASGLKSLQSIISAGNSNLNSDNSNIDHYDFFIDEHSKSNTSSTIPSSTSTTHNNHTSHTLSDYQSFLYREKANRQAARELASFVRVLAHEMSFEEFTAVESDVLKAILTLMHSNSSKSNSLQDKIKRQAGVVGLDALIGVTSSDEEKKTTKFAKNISSALESNTVDYDFLVGITRAFGKMAMGSANVDYVETMTTRALEWLMYFERSDRRLAAVLTLKEIAQKAPAAFYSKTNQIGPYGIDTNKFVDCIFPILRDPQPIVRVCAADTLAECLKILVDKSRKQPSTTNILCLVYAHVMEGFNPQRLLQKSNRKKMESSSQAQMEAAQHSSLLVVGDMIEHTQDFMLPRFDEVCHAVLALQNHPKALIRLEVIRLIPRLAIRCPGAFGRRYLETSLRYILNCISTPPNQRSGVDIRPKALTSLGHLALSMRDFENGSGLIPKSTLHIFRKQEEKDAGENYNTVSSSTNGPISYIMKDGDIYSNLDIIFALTKKNLTSEQPSTSRGASFISNSRTEALHCAADLVLALGPYSEPYIAGLLNDMFASGFSEDLIQCLRDISSHLPSQRTVIEERLMQEISINLAGTTDVNKICNPLSGLTLDRKSNGFLLDEEIHHEINMSDRPEVVMKLVLSLRTLGSFAPNFGLVAGTLLPFIRDVVSKYLSHPHAEVRREAVITCCFLLLPREDMKSGPGEANTGINALFHSRVHIESASGRLVEEVLQVLLRVAVSDPSPLVRHCIVRAFDFRYDPYLCQAHHVSSLFILLQDEALAIRAAALRLLGRLARLNPAQILPDLRKVLMDLIIELRCSGDVGSGKEAATRLLIVFLRSDALHRLVHPFVRAIIDALPLKGVAPRLASAALDALGELAIVAKDSLKPWVHQIIPYILESLQDQSSASKQRTSLRTLGLIAGAAEYVVTPYLEYPQILSQAANILPGTKRAPWALRREVIRTLGLLGALDPDQFNVSSGGNTMKGGGTGSGYFISLEDDPDMFSSRRGVSETSSSIHVASSNARLQYDPNNKDFNTTQSNVTEKLNVDLNQDGSESQSKINRNENDEDGPAHLYMYEQYAMTAQPISKLPPARRLSPSEEDFYPTVALQALTQILKDPSLAVHHGMVMQAVMFIFNSLGLRCVKFLNRIVPHILYTARTCTHASLREALLQQIANLSGIVQEHLRPFVPAIFEVVEEFWASKHLSTVLVLVEKMAAGVPDDFRKYVPGLVPRFLSSIDEFSSGRGIQNSSTIERLELILRTTRSLSRTLGEYIHLLIPSLLTLTDFLIHQTLNSLTKNAIQTIIVLLISANDIVGGKKGGLGSIEVGNSLIPARIAQPFMRMLGNESNVDYEVGLIIVDALCVSATLLGRERWIKLYHNAAYDAIMSWHQRVDLTLFHDVDSENIPGRITPENTNTPIIGIRKYEHVIKFLASSNDRLVSKNGLPSAFEALILNLDVMSSNDLIESNFPTVLSSNTLPISTQQNKNRVNQINLQRAWDVSQRTTRDEWDDWMRRFAVQLLREAPAPALRATAELAYAYQPLGRELFSAAFVCCWSDLQDEYRTSLINALKTAFFADSVSPEILQTLLNLAEFMEHDTIEGGGLPIEIEILAELALKCRSYAKALHYKEREHELGSGGQCIEDLISINKRLDLPEAALGVLKAAQVALERNGSQSWTMPIIDTKSGFRNELSSRIFHRHQGVGLAYSVMSTADEIAGKGSSAWVGVEMQESWLSKLGSWADALVVYERKLEEAPNDQETVLGCMKCLDARGEWRKVLDLATKSWDAFIDSSQMNSRKRVLKYCAQASWRLGQWEDLDTYTTQLIGNNSESFQQPTLDFDGAFYGAILNIHRKEWSLAADFIDAARKAMDSRFTALMAESHKRAYPSMVQAQTLAEMEEIIAYRKLEGRAKAGSHMHRANRDDEVEARRHLLSLWRKRLAGCRDDAEVHSSILAVRSLILGPTDEVEATLKLSALSLESRSFKVAERVLLEPLEKLGSDLNGPVFGFSIPASLQLGLLQTKNGKSASIHSIVYDDRKLFSPCYGPEHEKYCQTLIQNANGLDRLIVQHRLYYTYVKHLWATDDTTEAIDRLSRLANIVDMIAYYHRNQTNDLRVSCWLKLGEWKMAASNPTVSPLSQRAQEEVLTSLKRATSTESSGYKAWHAWALINFRLAQQYQEGKQADQSDPIAKKQGKSETSSDLLYQHVIAAIHGFVQAICLGTKRWSASVQQDLLNFLTCLFRYGEVSEVASVIQSEIGDITLDAWLGVLPQLLARIHIKSPSIRSVIHQLLTGLGRKHPQALMYPLSVLLKSPVMERKDAATSLMNTMKEHSYELVEQAQMVSSELIRVAILWLELWHEGLEEASRLHFGEGNVSGMLDVLLPLHEELERGPKTRRENDFFKTFGRDLKEAYAYVKEYIHLTTSDGGMIPTQGGVFAQSNQNDPNIGSSNAEAETALNQAWDLYYTVFRRINKQLPALTTLELSQCSPALLNAHNLELGVPGSYRVDGSYVKIEKFIPSVQVITSKQRPRKIALRGGDGKNYVFLLKGHEDLRQDERVMQLFGLVNALLAHDYRTNKHDLNIQRYTIAPLSHNAGVVGWVPHCDTLHSLIRDYRESKKIPLNMENREMLKIAQDYDLLTVMQKIEVFSEALDRTTGRGNDLYEVLWIKSTNSEEWLERRTKFTRSLSVMSIVGYILGLGDRHPSNLMLDQISGRVLHIDFGDCFEVAMHREKFPEKIPFRLTRMLVKAMECSGVEGSYRSTCERTMSVLRDNRDSLVAMLEAFVYDPLISWRLLCQASNEQVGESTEPVRQQQQQQQQQLSTESSPSRQNQTDQMSSFVRHNMVHETIQEGLNEDDALSDRASTEGGSIRDTGTMTKESSYDGFSRPHNKSIGAAITTTNTTTTNSATSSSRSLQMYSDIQSMAANLSATSRIASITGDGTYKAKAGADGSLARSRLQKEAYSMVLGDGGEIFVDENDEALNVKALKVIRRVQDKLTGTDFHPVDEANPLPLDVEDQVQRLIVQATSTENLCQLFIGWCAFW